MINREYLFKLGIGTWGIGGLDKRNPYNNDAKQIEALKYMFDHGLNFFETTLWYSEGSAAKLAKEALAQSSKTRTDIFISEAIYPHSLNSLNEAQQELEKFLRLFETDYVDTLQFTMSGILKYGVRESFDFLQRAINDGKTRFVSITNANLEMLKMFQERFEEKFFSHELAFNFEVRENEDAGLIRFAQEHTF